MNQTNQTANVIGLLRRCAEILEPHKLTMVLEPLNWEANHGGIHDRSKLENRDFVIGMEHGNSKPDKPGEEAVIQAYRDADAF